MFIVVIYDEFNIIYNFIMCYYVGILNSFCLFDCFVNEIKKLILNMCSLNFKI